MKKIIIDTDPGVDDALALTLAFMAKINILGITTVFGNSNIANTTKNALTIIKLLNQNIPVFIGASKPIKGKSIKAQSHGKNGLGGFSLKKINLFAEKKTAFDFLVKSLEKNEAKTIDIVVMGPSTNIALLNLKKPKLCQKIKRLIILGGVFSEKGNITKYAEFNIFNDPLAFKNILKINCEKILIPINICRKVLFTKKDFQSIKNPVLKKSLIKITKIYINYYTSNNKFGKFSGGVMYDLLTICYLLRPKLFLFNKKFINVELTGEKRGETSFSQNKKNNCSVITDVEAEKIKKLFLNTVNMS